MSECLGELKAATMGKISAKSGKSHMNALLRARIACGFEYLIIPSSLNTAMLSYYDAEIFSEIDKIDTKNKENSSRRFKFGEIGEHGFSNFPENWQN